MSKIDVTMTLFKKEFMFLSRNASQENVLFVNLCKNKDADQLRGGCAADQHHCFRYIDGTLAPLPKSEISSL